MNEQTNISFSLTNTGDSTEDFTVTISNGKESVDVQTGRLEAGQVYNAVVGITPDSLNSMRVYCSLYSQSDQFFSRCGNIFSNFGSRTILIDVLLRQKALFSQEVPTLTTFTK